MANGTTTSDEKTPSEQQTSGHASELASNLRAYAEQVVKEHDMESLHQLRVTLRRVRALVGACKERLEPQLVDAVRLNVRQLSKLTGPARDADVQLRNHEEDTHTLPEASVAKLEEQRGQSYKQIEVALKSTTFESFLEQLRSIDLIEGTAELLTVDALYARTRRLLKKSIKIGQSLSGASDDSEFHELRKRLKKLRYTLGFLLQESSEKRFAKAEKLLKQIQDYLGHFQDQTVRAGELQRRATEMFNYSAEPQELLDIGIRIGQTKQTIQYLKAGFPPVFDKFAKDVKRHLAE